MTTVTTTFFQATFVLGTFVHISNISISKLNTFDFSLVFSKIGNIQIIFKHSILETDRSTDLGIKAPNQSLTKYLHLLSSIID